MKYWNDQIIAKIRKGYYSAVYFNRTKHILEQEKNYKRVTVQVFQKNEGSTLCGVDEVLELLKVGMGYWDPPSSRLNRDFGEARWISKFDDLEVKSLADGDKINSWETVMHISGPYVYFAHLESLYLGILARRTMVATQTRKVVEAAQGKDIIFFADRFDHFLNQEGDGYAAHVGGAAGICTEAMGNWWGGKPAGTIPHSLIAINNGNTSESAKQFMKYYKGEKVIALVDFENDCVKTSLEIARVLKDKLWGVRLDTAENMIDKSLDGGPVPRVSQGRASTASRNDSFTNHNLSSRSQNEAPLGNPSLVPPPRDEFSGVNPALVKLVRQALDKEGFKRVKIIVSGGFNQEKIKLFEKEETPVDVYGVGSSLVHGANDFTADIVKVEDKLIAKVGREYKENKRLKIIKN